MIDIDYFSKDIKEFLKLLAEYGVKYLIVGGEAVIYYGHARLTGDIDIYYSMKSENIEKLYEALKSFWGEVIPHVDSIDDLKKEGMIIQFGLPPNRIDLINSLEPFTFEEAWENRLEEKLEFKGKIYPIYFIGIKDLIANKKLAGRNKDIEDLKFLLKKVKKDSK